MVSRLSDFEITGKPDCMFFVALVWRENIKLIDSDKRDFLHKEQTAN